MHCFQKQTHTHSYIPCTKHEAIGSRLDKYRLENRRLENHRLENCRLENCRLDNHRLKNCRLENHRLDNHRLENCRIGKLHIPSPPPGFCPTAMEKIRSGAWEWGYHLPTTCCTTVTRQCSKRNSLTQPQLKRNTTTVYQIILRSLVNFTFTPYM